MKIRGGASNPKVSSAHTKAGARVLRSFRSTGWQRVRLPHGWDVQRGIEFYKKLGDVLKVQPNFVYHVTATPADPSYDTLYGMRKIHAPAAWDLTTGNPAVVVAVIDTGVDASHPDLAANIWANPGEIPGNGLDDDANGYVDDVHGWDAVNKDGDPSDDHNHGTHVAGTIGAVGNNNVGVAGVNWNVRIMALKFINAAGDGSSADAMACFEYAALMKSRGVNLRVTNNSWGGGGYDAALEDAMRAANDAGILHVFSAGNSGMNNDVTPDFPTTSSLPGIISVAASDVEDKPAYFTSYGLTTVDLAAPGVGILSTIPGGGYASYNGTSMAAPHVTGAAALLAGYDETQTVASLKAALLGNVDPLPAWSGRVATGGRLNVAKALQDLQTSALPHANLVAPLGPSIPVTSPISVTFNRPMDRASVQAAFLVAPTVDGTFAWGDGDRTLTFTPANPLSFSTAYTVRIRGEAQSATGNALDGDRDGISEGSPADEFTWSFTTKGMPPANDDWTNAQVITGVTGSVTGTTRDATKEAGEPNHGSNSGGASVWYRWTAPIDGTATFATAGSGFDTTLAAYTGTGPAALTLVTQNDEANWYLDSTSRVSFSVTAGDTYTFAVDGFNGITGNLRLAWEIRNTQTKIIDNWGAGFNITSGWNYFMYGGYDYDLYFAPTGTGSETATWTFSRLTPGEYRVSATWTDHDNRATNVPYTIKDGGTLLTQVTKNQQFPPNDFATLDAVWEDLGRVIVRSSSLEVQVTNAANGYVIADAMRIERVGDLPPEPEIQVLDGSSNLTDGGNVDFGATYTGVPIRKTFTVKNTGTGPLNLSAPTLPAGFSLVSGFGSATLAPNAEMALTVQMDAVAAGTLSGTLSFGTNDADENPFEINVSGRTMIRTLLVDDGDAGFASSGSWTHWKTGGYETDLRFAAPGSGEAATTWTFSGLTPGRYRISATWVPYSNRAKNAPFTASDGATVLAQATLNQQAAPNDFTASGTAWEDVSTLYVHGTGLVVRLTNAANGYVIADAVRVERIGELPVGPEMQVWDGAKELTDGGGLEFGNAFVGSPARKTLTIKNIGSGTLNLNGSVILPAGYSVASGFGSLSLAPNAETTVTIQMDAASVGTPGGALSFGSNDADENPFALALSGSVTLWWQAKDDGDTGFGTTGTWTRWTSGGFNGDLFFAPAGTGDAGAVWTFTGLTPGQYRVAATWVDHSNRATNAPFTILNGDTSLGTVPVNQRLSPGSFSHAGRPWKYLGDRYALTGNTLTVRLTNAANGYVIADGVRIERVGDLPSAP